MRFLGLRKDRGATTAVSILTNILLHVPYTAMAPHALNTLQHGATTAESKELERGCRMVHAGFPSFFGLRWRTIMFQLSGFLLYSCIVWNTPKPFCDFQPLLASCANRCRRFRPGVRWVYPETLLEFLFEYVRFAA